MTAFDRGAVCVGGAVLLASTVVARTRVVHPAEDRAFRTVNDLPKGLLPPAFVLMQAGSFASVFVTAEGLRRAGKPRTAAATVVAGSAAWVGCKAIKRWVGRGRPTAHLALVTTRGPTETGLGFPSGHSAVAVTLASLVAPSLPPSVRPAVWAWAGTVVLARIYVGAHLPLDVVGGAATGLVIGGSTRLALEGLSRGPERRQPR